MRTRVVVGVALATLFALHGFAQVGLWKNFTSMQDVRAIARSGSTFWAATSGGLFAWTEGSESYTRYTNADGLQTTDLTAVAVDGNGDVWTGASGGMLHVLTPETGTWRYVSDVAGTSQTNKRINGIVVGGDSLLVSTGFGLSVFRVNQFQFGDTYSKFGNLASMRVSVSSAVSFGGKLWAAVTDGQSINRVVSASLSNPNLLPPELWSVELIGAGARVNHLVVFNNKLYAGTTSGLFVSNGGAWAPVDSLIGRSIVALNASSSVLAICEANNVVDTLSLQNQFGRITAAPFTLSSAVISASHKPVVGTNGGGIMTFQASWTSHFPNGPGSNQFLSIAVDLDGNVWGASGQDGGGKGFYRFDGTTWKTFTRANTPALSSNDYNRASVGCNGDVWLGGWGDGVKLVRIPRGSDRVDSSNVFGQNVGISAIAANPNYRVVGSVICDAKGNTWVPVMVPQDRRALVVRKPDGSWSSLPFLIGGEAQAYITEGFVTRPFAVDASDNLWVSVLGGRRGLASLNNRGSASDSVADILLTTANGLPSEQVRTVVVDKDNDIWVGTDGGIAIILDPNNPTRSGGIASYKPLNGLVVNAIAVDPLNQKWVGTNEGAVLLSRDGTQALAQYTVANTNGRLISNEIKDIAIDAQFGTVYFATVNGLSSVTTTSAQPKEEFDELAISPNPYRIPSSVPLTIDGLVENSTIMILTIDGHRVREVQTPGGRIGFWDGRDDAGKDVASGIYLIVGYSDSKKVGKGKVAVLRK